jgi:choline kinase
MIKKMKQIPDMKAIILAAGVGSRIRPMTDNCPKCLLEIGGVTILERMLSNIQACGINDVVFVLGYLQEQIEDFVKNSFPDLNAQFIVNDLYGETNTGYSLMLAEEYVKGSTFVKFDADVVFDKVILENLLASEDQNWLCIDKNIQLDAEEIKVVVEENNRIIRASKTVMPQDANGESIGIEKISCDTAVLLFAELRSMMEHAQNHQEYYEGAYERLMKKGVPFYAIDITGLKWTEIDTKQDFQIAENTFV